MTIKKLYVLTKDWSRHGNYSGYERLLSYLETPFSLVRCFFVPYKLGSYFRDRTKLINYRTDTFSKELRVLLNFFKGKTIHVQYADMDYYYLHWLKRFPFNLRRNTLVATFHNPPNELEKRMEYDRYRVLGALDKLIVMGPNQISFFSNYTDAEIRFIPHGINLDYFKPNPDIVKLDQFLILGISHRDHERTIEIIKAFPKGITCQFIVVMPSKYAKVYQDLDRVHLVTENISDHRLLKYYQESKGLLLSLNDCTASNSILEALACGCPLITNKVGAVESYIPHDSGIPVFDTYDIDGSISHMLKLLHNKSYADTLSHKQTELAKKYDWKLIAKATEDFILQ